MLLTLLQAKIHGGTVTAVSLEYEGSLTLDEALMDAAGLRPFQQVQIANLHNGERFETYVISGPRGSGALILNGPTARKGMPGDRVMIFAYGVYTEEEAKTHRPILIRVDDKNKPL